MTTLVEALSVMGIAATPVLELRAAIPLALHTFDLSIGPALALSVIGNMIPPILIIMFLDPFMRFLGKYIPAVHRFADKTLAHAREKVRPQVERYGAIGLLIFVAVPLPLTGAWTGALGAALLGIAWRKAVLGVFGGVCVAAALVLAADLGIAKFINFIR